MKPKPRSEGSIAVASQGGQKNLPPGGHRVCEGPGVRERIQSLRSWKNLDTAERPVHRGGRGRART